MKIVFFGTPGFAASILRYLVEEGKHEIVGVVSKPDKPRGRDLKICPTEVRSLHDELLPHVPIFQPRRVSAPEIAQVLQELKADLFVVVAYGEIIKPLILSLPRYGCINIHASILPSYRGAAPMQRALIDGVKETGVTIMRMDEGLDSGDIISIHTFPVPEDMDMAGLSTAMMEAAKTGLSHALSEIDSGTACYMPQDHSKMTIAPKITPEELALSLHAPSAWELHNKVRAFSPRPGAYTYVSLRGDIKRLKILKTRVVPKKSGNTSLSSVHVAQSDKEGIRLYLPQDPINDLVIERLQIEGKKEMSASEFTRGFPIQEVSFSV